MSPVARGGEGHEPTEGSGSTVGPVLRRNYAVLGESNFASLLDTMIVEKRQVLEFAYDSMRLGEGNRRSLARMIEGFDPTTDVMSVIGCSLGKSRIPNGNRYLATGRANRVKEALVYLGLPPGSVLDEACWAERERPDLPARGVIVTRRTLDEAA